MSRYNHAFDFCFEVNSLEENADDVTAEILRYELLKRANELSDDEMLEACGLFDTMMVEVEA